MIPQRGEGVKLLQLPGKVILGKIVELAGSKMQNNYLQSFGSYEQHQENTPYFQNHPGASNSISNFNPTNQYTGNQYDAFFPRNSNNNQFVSTKIATNQNSELTEI